MAKASRSRSNEGEGAGRMARAFACALVALCACGCATHVEAEYDAQHPAVRVTRSGVLLRDRPVRPEEVVEHLREYGVAHDSTIHIRLDPDVRDMRPARYLMAVLCRAGYTRPVLVTARHAESANLGKPRKAKAADRTNGGRRL